MDDKTKKIIIASVIGALAIAVLVLSLVLNHKSKALNVSEQNVRALSDTLTEVRLENGNLLAYQNALVIDKKNLEAYLGVTKTEVEELEDKLNSKLLIINKLKTQSRVDTVFMETRRTCYDNEGYCRYEFSNGDKYYQIGGYVDVDTLDSATVVIVDNEMNMDLKVGLDEDWKIFVTTDNPYVKFGSVQGALLDKNVYLKQQKKNRWGIGVQVGFGGQYGIINKKFDVGPYVGIGISYNFVVF